MKRLNLSSTAGKSESNFTTSKGNQPKFFDENNNFIKCDFLGYEGLSEIICSRLLDISSCDYFVKYNEIQVNINGKIYRGCTSENFLLPNQKIITLYRLFQSNGIQIEKELKNLSLKDRINHTIHLVKDITGLDSFFDWLISVLKFDFLVLNEDRHFNNLGVLYNYDTNKFSLMPVFDNGASFLSDVNQYPFHFLIKDNIKKVQGKPFSTNIQKQFEACCVLSDVVFKIDYKRIQAIFESDFLYYCNEEVERCVTILENRLRLYEKYFK